MNEDIAYYYSMPCCTHCRNRKGITQALCDELGIEFTVVNIADIVKKSDLEALHLHNLPTLRYKGKELVGEYTSGELREFLKGSP